VLIAYVMLVTPLGFQQLAQADVLYQNLRATDWGADGETITYTYDTNGSVETKVVNSGGTETTFTYTYNLQNRLAKVTVDDGDSTDEVIEYQYNSDGIRVQSYYYELTGITKANEETKTFLIDAYNHTGYAQVFKETVDDGSITTTSYIIGDDILAQAIGSATPQYLLYDGHGSTRQLSDSDGDLITNESYSYDAYGVMLGGDRATQTDLLYTGEMYDSVMDAYYLRARYYSPSTGTFNRVDPFAGNNLDPQSLHKYTYAHNNPVNRIDPSGNFPINLAMVLTTLAVLTVIIALGFRGRASSPRHRSYDLTKACAKYDEQTCNAVGEPNYDERKCRIEAIVLTARYQTGLLRYWKTGPWYTQCKQYVTVIRDIIRPTAGLDYFTIAEGGYTNWFDGHHYYVGVFHKCNRVDRRSKYAKFPLYEYGDTSDATLDPWAIGGVPLFYNKYFGNPYVQEGRGTMWPWSRIDEHEQRLRRP
jgi:RHS repeat-associated protein